MSTIQQYKEIQDEITKKIGEEKRQIVKQKLEKIAADKSKSSFWKEKKKMSRDPVLQALTIKDADSSNQKQSSTIQQCTTKTYTV